MNLWARLAARVARWLDRKVTQPPLDLGELDYGPWHD